MKPRKISEKNCPFLLGTVFQIIQKTKKQWLHPPITKSLTPSSTKMNTLKKVSTTTSPNKKKMMTPVSTPNLSPSHTSMNSPKKSKKQKR